MAKLHVAISLCWVLIVPNCVINHPDCGIEFIIGPIPCNSSMLCLWLNILYWPSIHNQEIVLHDYVTTVFLPFKKGFHCGEEISEWYLQVEMRYEDNQISVLSLYALCRKLVHVHAVFEVSLTQNILLIHYFLPFYGAEILDPDRLNSTQYPLSFPKWQCCTGCSTSSDRENHSRKKTSQEPSIIWLVSYVCKESYLVRPWRMTL